MQNAWGMSLCPYSSWSSSVGNSSSPLQDPSTPLPAGLGGKEHSMSLSCALQITQLQALPFTSFHKTGRKTVPIFKVACTYMGEENWLMRTPNDFYRP